MISKTETGKWLADIQPNGRAGKRMRKTFATKAEAMAWERYTISQATTNPDWLAPKKDHRTLTNLFDLWLYAHGSHLKDGHGTHKRLIAFAEAIGNPAIHHFTTQHFLDYRSGRIVEGIKPATINREHATAKAALNTLIQLKIYNGKNPLNEIKQIKIDESELVFLDQAAIKQLLAELESSSNPHVRLIALICLATGSRWSEAENLRLSQCQRQDDDQGRIQYAKTKSSKARAVPVTCSLLDALRAHHQEHGQGQQIFGPSYGAFREAVERAKIILPDGQLTHVLRHTFASHFMQGGGNILTLQKILGHHSITMTMRYSHLSPDHLQAALDLNPLKRLGDANPLQ